MASSGRAMPPGGAGVLGAGCLRGVQWMTDASPEKLRSVIDRGEFFWLDLLKPAWEHVAELAEAAGVGP